MAGIGDALLAFTSGAAGVINEDAQKSREFMRKQKAKIAESRLVRQEKVHDKKVAEYDVVRQYGTGMKAQYMHIFNITKDDEVAARAAKSGEFESVLKGIKDPGEFVPYAVGMSNAEYREVYGNESIGSKLLSKFGKVDERRSTYRTDERAGRNADMQTLSDRADALGIKDVVTETPSSFFDREKAIKIHGKAEEMLVDNKLTLVSRSETGEFIVGGKVVHPDRVSVVDEADKSADALIRFQEERLALEEDLRKNPNDTDAERRLADVNSMINKMTTLVGRTEADEDFRTRNKRRLQQVTSQLTNIDIALRSLVRLGKVSTEKQKGAPGALQDFGLALKDAVRGLSDLAGLTESITDDDRKSIIRAAGITDATLEKLEGGALRGLNLVEKYNVVYAVAGGMKDFGRKAVNNLDITLAMELVSKVGGSQGAGVILGLERALKNRQIDLYKNAFLMEGLTTDESTRFGRRYLEASENIDSKGWFIAKDGTVYIEGPNDTALNLKEFLVRGGIR